MSGVGPLDVLVFGEAIVDFFSEEPGRPLSEVDLFRRHLGGAPANVAVALARQGRQVALMTLVGPDEFGRFVRARLESEGVHVHAVGTHPTHKTAITFVTVAEDGTRSFMSFRHPSADQHIAPADVDADAIRAARLFHFGSSTMAREPGRSATLHAFEIAASSGRLLSADPNFRPHIWECPDEAPPLLRPLIGRCDVVKVADDELLPLAGTGDPEAGARALRALGAKLVLVSMGPRGCYFDGPGGRGYVPGERAPVVDVTGAGDAFTAGVLSALLPRLVGGRGVADLDEAALRTACERGNHLGACAATALGASTAVPRAPR